MLKVQWVGSSGETHFFLVPYVIFDQETIWTEMPSENNMRKYGSPDLTRQFCCKGGSSCGFAYKHFLFVELQFLITHNCEGFHVSHVSSMSIQNWIIIMSFPFIFSPSPSSIHLTQRLRRRECDWRSLFSVGQNTKPKPVIQLISYTRSSSNNPGIIENANQAVGDTQCSKTNEYCL